METVLQTYGLTKQYGSFTALSNLDLALERGKIIGLLGPNGSGKTTFIKLCCGLIKPTAGDILICGMPIGVETKKVVSYLPDRNFIPDDMKVNEMLRFFQDFYMAHRFYRRRCKFPRRKTYEDQRQSFYGS